jgi:hypothetical protein
VWLALNSQDKLLTICRHCHLLWGKGKKILVFIGDISPTFILYSCCFLLVSWLNFWFLLVHSSVDLNITKSQLTRAICNPTPPVRTLKFVNISSNFGKNLNDTMRYNQGLRGNWFMKITWNITSRYTVSLRHCLRWYHFEKCLVFEKVVQGRMV